MEFRIMNLSFPGRIMTLHGSSIFSSTMERDVLLKGIGLRAITPAFLGGSLSVTDHSWTTPMGCALYQSVDEVVLEKSGEGCCVTLRGKAFFGDIEMMLKRRLNYVFLVADGYVEISPLDMAEHTAESTLDVLYRSVVAVEVPEEEDFEEDGNLQPWAEMREIAFTNVGLFPDTAEEPEPLLGPVWCRLFQSERHLDQRGLKFFHEIEDFVDWFFDENGSDSFLDDPSDNERVDFCRRCRLTCKPAR
jgi:hypothetical protein